MTFACYLRLAAAALAVAVTAGPAAAADVLKTRYDLYAGGMQVFAIDYAAELTGAEYASTARIRPVGLAGLFIDLDMAMHGNGRLTGSGARPSSFRMKLDEGKRTQATEVDWSGREPKTRRNFKLDPERARAVADSLTADTRDTLAAIVGLVTHTAEPCAGSHRVYNGKEVFDLSLTRIKAARFGDKDGGVYRGPAVACRVQYAPVAGLSAKTMARQRKNPPVFNVWLAPVRAAGLDRDIQVIVGVTGKLKGRDFVAYLNEATLSGKPLNAHSLARR